MDKSDVFSKARSVFDKFGIDVSLHKYTELKRSENPSLRQIIKHFGSWSNFKNYCMDHMNITNNKTEEIVNDIINTDFRENMGVILSKTKRIKTPDQLMDECHIDRNIWEIDRVVINKWEVGMRNKKGSWVAKDGKLDCSVEYANEPIVEPLIQIKIWLKKKVSNTIDGIKEEIEEVLSEIRTNSYNIPTIKRYRGIKDSCLYEISIMDLHLAKLGWHEEVGDDYDLDIAEELYSNAIDELLGKVGGFNIDKIVLPTGNDFFHVDNIFNQSTAGTPQDVDSRWQKAFRRGRTLLINSISKLSQVATVEVPIIPGNHDMERSFYLGEVLDAYFYNNRNVIVNNSPSLRKYVKYGVNLIGYTHGKEEKFADLPLIMARECKSYWSDVSFYEWHVGHTHKKREYKYNAGDTFNGVVIRVIPSLCSTDAWHYKKGFVKGRRSAEAYIWSKDSGYIGHFATNIVEE